MTTKISKSQGLKEGRVLGREEGLKEGRVLGREEGLKEGDVLGREKGLLEAARNMKALGLDDETIMKATGISVLQ